MQRSTLYLLIGMLCISIAVSVPSLMRIPVLLPFLQEEVRAAAPHAIAAARQQGLWMLNTDIHQIYRNDDDICFVWEYRYNARFIRGTYELIETCV